MTEEALKEFGEQISDQTAQKLSDKFGLEEPTTAPPAPDPQPKLSARDFSPPENETKAMRQRRINAAVKAMASGDLPQEEAPKEIKTIRFFRALAENDQAVLKALSEGSAVDGGNLVPIEYGTDLLVAIEDYSTVNDCSYHEMTTNELDLRTVTTKPVIYQVNEAAAVTEAAPKFGKPQLTAYAFAGLQVMSKELFQDNNVSLYDKLVTLFAEALYGRISQEILVGTTMTGFLANTDVTETEVPGTNFSDIDYQTLVTASWSLSPGQLGNGGKWYMHRTVFGLINGLVDANGRPIVTDPWNEMQRRLLGYPVVLDEQAPSTSAADTGFIGFGNLKWIDFGMRQDIAAKVLTEATVASVNLAEKRSLGLIIDTRWGHVVSQPSYLAKISTQA
jgi:HK97 family phage major capsid protein